MEEQEKNTRLFVLEESLRLEKYISDLLGDLLKIENESSETLGNKSTALSLNQKVSLLIDIKTIDKKDKTLLLNFMSIRNQFMHNANAKSFDKCISYISGLDNWFKKKYEKLESDSFESYYRKSFLELSTEVFGILNDKVLPILLEKTTFDYEKDHALQSRSDFALRMSKYLDNLPEILNEYFGIETNSESMDKFMLKLRNDIVKMYSI